MSMAYLMGILATIGHTYFWILLFLPLWKLGRRRDFAMIIIVIIISEFTCGFLKLIAGTPRPEDANYIAFDVVLFVPAFPSGHAMRVIATTTYASIRMPNISWLPMPLGIGCAYARLYTRVHWPVDVAVGSMVGVVIALFVLLIYYRTDWYKWLDGDDWRERGVEWLRKYHLMRRPKTIKNA